MKQLLVKLASVKREIGTLSKNASNPFFKSKYLDLNEILTHLEPLLDKHGLILLQPVTGTTVCTQIHDTATGDSVSSCINVPELTDPQKVGSAITYYRRYSLQSLLALQAEDDDANTASGKKTETPKRNDFTLDLAGCENADDMNAFEKKHFMSKWTDEQKKEAWAHAKAIGVTWDKSKKAFV